MSILPVFVNPCYNCGYVNERSGEPVLTCKHCRATLRWQDEQNYSEKHRAKLMAQEALLRSNEK